MGDLGRVWCHEACEVVLENGVALHINIFLICLCLVEGLTGHKSLYKICISQSSGTLTCVIVFYLFIGQKQTLTLETCNTQPLPHPKRTPT